MNPKVSVLIGTPGLFIPITFHNPKGPNKFHKATYDGALIQHPLSRIRLKTMQFIHCNTFVHFA